MLKSAPLKTVAAVIALSIQASVLVPPFLHAEPASIGDAVSVENRVTGARSGKVIEIEPGQAVFGSEVVRTESNSLARLTFLDQTNLAIGPGSSVTLDKFVYDADSSAASVVLNTAKGGFRFVTGQSDPRAFKINTPVATIGIRGTVLDIENSGGQSLIVLKKGGLHVCVRGSATNCVDLNEPDQFVIVRKGSVSAPQAGGSQEFDFHRYCIERELHHWEICDLGGTFAGNDSLPLKHGRGAEPPPPPPPARTCTQRGC